MGRSIVVAPVPPPVREYFDLLGEAAALRLVETFPSIRLYVPEKVMPRGQLVKAIGIDAARLMVAHYGGAELLIPAVKHWRVRVYRGRGMSVQTIARRVGLSETSVYRVLARSNIFPDQLALNL